MTKFNDISFADLHLLALLPVTKKFIEEESVRKDYDAVMSIRRNIYDRYNFLSKMSAEELHTHDLAEAVHLGYVDVNPMDESLELSESERGIINDRYIREGYRPLFVGADYLLNEIHQAYTKTSIGEDYYQYIKDSAHDGNIGEILSCRDFLNMKMRFYREMIGSYHTSTAGVLTAGVLTATELTASEIEAHDMYGEYGYHDGFFNTLVRVGEKVYSYQACLMQQTEGLTQSQIDGDDQPGFIDQVDPDHPGDDWGMCEVANAELALALGGKDAVSELGKTLYNSTTD